MSGSRNYGGNITPSAAAHTGNIHYTYNFILHRITCRKLNHASFIKITTPHTTSMNAGS
jgi:hypothetical protein